MSENNFVAASLIERITQGDQCAFRFFYDITYPIVYRFVHYFISGKRDCEDVVSEVFHTVWKQRDTLSEVHDLKAWLYIVGRNEAYHFLKRKDRYAQTSIDDLPVELKVEAISAEDYLIEKDMLSVYNEAVVSLPERCKLIFLMVREDGLRHKEIAKILSITEGTVEQQMNIAIRKIVELVKKYYPFVVRNQKNVK